MSVFTYMPIMILFPSAIRPEESPETQVIQAVLVVRVGQGRQAVPRVQTGRGPRPMTTAILPFLQAKIAVARL